MDLEEGYITFTSLPAGLLLKAGKMCGAFGVVNTLHNHVLPWTDRPLVTRPCDLIVLGRERGFQHRLLCGDSTDREQVRRLMGAHRIVIRRFPNFISI